MAGRGHQGLEALIEMAIAYHQWDRFAKSFSQKSEIAGPSLGQGRMVAGI
jgi:hypothetical protein